MNNLDETPCILLIFLLKVDLSSVCFAKYLELDFSSFLGLAGDLKKAMKDGKPIIIEV